jgi:uncharacterized coiled-coil protein SlyX
MEDVVNAFARLALSCLRRRSRLAMEVTATAAFQLMLEPVDTVQRNFDAIAAAFTGLTVRLGHLECSEQRGAVLQDDVNDVIAALAHRVDGLQNENRELMQRVAELEGHGGGGGAPGTSQTSLGVAPLSPPEGTLIQRLVALEAWAGAHGERTSRFETATQATFGSIWSEIHSLQRKLSDVPRPEDFVKLDQFNSFAHATTQLIDAVRDDTRGLKTTTTNHGQRLTLLEQQVATLAAEWPRDEALRDWLRRLEAGESGLAERLDAMYQRLEKAESDVTRALQTATAAAEAAASASANADETRQSLSTRLDRLAASTAKSLRALESLIASLKMGNVTKSVSTNDDPLIIRKRIACLSCDPLTAAEYRPEAMRHKPSAPSARGASAGRGGLAGVRLLQSGPLSPTNGAHDDVCEATTD